jgi:glycosyltransferase involved in cell wall biosynthesis
MIIDRPRWVLVTIDYPPADGGISRLLAALVQHSASHVEWLVISLSPGEETGTVRRVSKIGLAPALRDAVAWSKQRHGARLICGHAYLAFVVLMAARFGRVPCAALVYGLEVLPRRPQQRALLSALRSFDRVLSITEWTSSFLPRLGVAAARTSVVHPALATSALPAARESSAAGRGLRLVLVSRLSERYKNIDILQAMLLVLHESGAVERCVVVGDGPLREGYRREAERAGLGEVLRFPGRLSDDDVRELLHHSDLGVFPSRTSSAEGGFEGFGLVVHEMAAAGLPVLVGDAAGAREAADPAWSLLLDPDDTAAWAAAVHELYTDRERLARLARAAEEWALRANPSVAVHRMVTELSK